MMSTFRVLSLGAILFLPLLGGCAAAVAIPSSVGAGATTVGAAGAGAGAKEGTSYALSSTVYRSFTYPQAKVHAAALQALKKMSIPLTEDKERSHVIKIRAETKDIKIAISVIPVTPTVTKISASAKRNFFVKDAPVADEILNQVAKALAEQ